MAITLDGTTGITTPGLTNTGTETIVNLTTTGNTILGDASTDTLNVGNGGLVKDASGNLGLGVTPSTYSVGKVVEVGFAGNAFWGYAANTNLITQNTNLVAGVFKYSSTNPASYYQQSASAHSWGIAPSGTAGNNVTFTQAMTLDASGRLLIGQTTASNSVNGLYFDPAGGGGSANIVHASGSASGTGYAYFLYAGSSIGSITQNGTTAVAYNTTSDYRLKTDVTPIQNALSTITALNPVSFTWIDGRPDDGFLAHELQEILPNCVTGEKDAVNEDGTPKYQQMDSSGVVPFLVKAIQEQQAMIDELKAKVAALEAA